MWMVVAGLAIGVAAGILSGLFGIGGGVVIVPALVAFGLTQREASGTSLAVLLLPVGLLGVVEYARRGEIRFEFAAGIAIGVFAGAFVGAHYAGLISNTLLQRLFGGLMLLISLRFIFF